MHRKRKPDKSNSGKVGPEEPLMRLKARKAWQIGNDRAVGNILCRRDGALIRGRGNWLSECAALGL